MDDDTFDDINEQSFIDDDDDDDDEENNNWGDMAQGQDVGGTGGPTNQQAGGGGLEAMIPSQDHDFQSQVHVVMRPKFGPGRSYVPEPRPQNVETELHYKVDKPEFRKRTRQMPRVQELAKSKFAYDLLKAELDNLRKEHERQRSLKTRYRAEVKQLKMAHPEREIVRHFSYVTARTAPITSRAPGGTQYLSYRQDEEMLVYSRQMGEQHGIAKVSMRDFTNNFHDFTPVHTKPIKDVRCYNGHPGTNRSLVLTASLDKTLKVTSASSKQVVLTYDFEGAAWSCCWSTTDPNLMYCSVKAKQTSILTLDLRNTRAPVSSFSNPKLLGHAPINTMTHIGAFEGHGQEAILCGSLDGAFVYNFESSTQMGTLSGVLSQEMIVSGSQGSTAIGGDSLSSSQTMATASSLGTAEKEKDCRLPVRLHGGSCMSVSFDNASRNWMATYNFLGGKTAQHVRGTVDQDPYTGDLLLRSEYKIMGGAPVPWSRNSIFTRLNGSVHMAAGSDSVAHVWYDPRFRSKRAQEEENERMQATLSGGRLISTLDMGPLAQHALKNENNPLQGSLIRDVKPVVVSGMDEYLVTLSDKELGIYRWTESQPGFGGLGNGEDGDSDDEVLSEILEDEDDAGEPVPLRNKGKRRRVDYDEDDDGDVVIVGESVAGGGVTGGPSSTASSPMFNTQ
ncbi:RING finger and WD repeat domain-containing protein 3 [Mortierella sp. 14UC]|nr:RING finger and WD repeat domain-containing protein 3 [Mortierella sp. 14UC]